MFIRNFQGTYEHPSTTKTLKTIKQKHDESLRDYVKHFCNVKNGIPYIQDIEIINDFWDVISDLKTVEEIAMKMSKTVADLLAVADVCIEASEAWARLLEARGYQEEGTIGRSTLQNEEIRMTVEDTAIAENNTLIRGKRDPLRNQVISSLVWLWWVIDLVRFEFESGTVSFWFSFNFASFRESCLLVSWCAGVKWHHVRSAPCTWRRGARVSRLNLKTKVDGLWVIWPKNHSDGFSSIWASKLMATVCEWFGLKTTQTVFTGLASKWVATVSGGLASKLAAMVSGGLASKPVATVSDGFASKPVVTVFFSLASKLVVTVSPDLASKPRWWRVSRFRH
jgi:hypothetical protein